MRLADHILAARGTLNDFCGMITSLSAGIEKAQRFSIDNDVAKAAVGVVRSRPSSLVAALPLCRLPFPKVWLEWSPDEKTGRGQGRDNVVAPTPWRMGVLIEANHVSLQIGQMTFAWMHPDIDAPGDGVNVCPLSIIFDWREEGDLPTTMAPIFDEAVRRGLLTGNYGSVLRGMRAAYLTPYRPEKAQADMRSHALQRGWGKLANDPREVAAVCELVRHTSPWISNHGVAFMKHASGLPNFMEMLKLWEADLEGEEPYAAALITMMNSRNCVVQDAADLTKLNRSRRRSGKPEFLPYTTTRLRIAQHLRRAVMEGRMTHDEAREHDVRGHFKLRSTGVFWWSPFKRGDPTRPMPRREYEVME